MEKSPRSVSGGGGKPRGWRAIRDVLDPDGSAWALIRSGEQRYARRRTGNDSSPSSTPKG